MSLREPLARKLIELEWGRPRHAPLRADPLADLEQRMREAQVWCGLHVNTNAPATCLRPSHLAPPTLGSDRWRQIDDVLKRRRRDLVSGRPVSGNELGRFLLYFPDVDVGTCAGQLDSAGFFDAHTAPPWGTWVGYFEERANPSAFAHYLLAWIPADFEASADAAVHATPEECIQWFEDANVELRNIVASLEAESSRPPCKQTHKNPLPGGTQRHN